MKILAIEKEIENVDWINQTEILEREASLVYDYYLDGFIREIYFNENKNAVLILECESVEIAKEFLDELPLVKNGFIEFQIMVLKPYTGFNRILKI